MSEDFLIKKRVKFIQRAFGTSILDRDGVNVAVSCVNKKCSTFGRPAKKKLVIRVDNEFYHCWTCGLRGKGLNIFLRKYLPRYAPQAGELFEKRLIEKSEETRPPVLLPDGFTLLATLPKLCDPDLRACRSYLLSRGYTDRELWYFRIGACSSGRFRRRVIVPSFDLEGELNYFTARSIDDSARKYMNPKVKRSEIIFNELNIDWKKELVLLEGPFDLMKSGCNATCLLGSTLNERHALFRSIVANRTPVVLALDSDAVKKTQQIASLLYSYDISVKILKICAYDDVGDMPIGKFTEVLSSAKAWTANERLRSLIGTIKSGSLI